MIAPDSLSYCSQSFVKYVEAEKLICDDSSQKEAASSETHRLRTDVDNLNSRLTSLSLNRHQHEADAKQIQYLKGDCAGLITSNQGMV